jgi:hypothetical protein
MKMGRHGTEHEPLRPQEAEWCVVCVDERASKSSAGRPCPDDAHHHYTDSECLDHASCKTLKAACECTHMHTTRGRVVVDGGSVRGSV